MFEPPARVADGAHIPSMATYRELYKQVRCRAVSPCGGPRFGAAAWDGRACVRRARRGIVCCWRGRVTAVSRWPRCDVAVCGVSVEGADGPCGVRLWRRARERLSWLLT
jgi:hypothetical protein